MRRYSGLNINIDRVGTESLLSLADCLLSAPSGVRTLHLQEPTRSVLSIPGHAGDFEWFGKVKLDYDKHYEGTEFSIQRENIGLAIGTAGVVQLTEALERYKNGAYDFSLACEVRGGGKYDRALWFW